jgi:hypothetical protein
MKQLANGILSLDAIHMGIEKESAHDYPSDNENISQLEVNRGGRTFVRHSLGMPHTSPLLEMENVFVCDGRKH